MKHIIVAKRGEIMIFKILKRDFFRKKVITIAVFVFVMLSALLAASGTNLLIDLSNSLDYLFKKASAPHFVQYHAGDIEQKQIAEWSEANPYVKSQQTSEMINIDGAKIYINSDLSESDTVMDLGFVKQNRTFDYLLNLDNEIITVNEAEIAVPIHYMQSKDLSIGDKLVIKDDNLELNFTITHFVRDAQMNPSVVSSKRFVVSSADFEKLKNGTGEIEYLISFQLIDRADLNKFSNQYSRSVLPKKGPAIDYQLLLLFNSLTDGIIAVVIIIISFLLNIIALLCLRFVILLTIEEDYKEIGVMKAIGISPPDIKRIYISKYFVIALGASLSGYLFSLFVNKIFSKNIMLYIGKAPKSIFMSGIPLLAAFIIGLIVVFFSMIVLRRLNKISPVEAIRMGNTGGNYSNNEKFSLYKSKLLNTNIFLGIRDVVLRFKFYILLFFVFILATFIIIVPLNLLNTLQSEGFVTYMGLGQSDIIMDIRQSDQIVERFEEVKTYLESDLDVKRYSPLVTSTYEIMNIDNLPESIYIETGDLTVFPIDYIEGMAPLQANEIALSYLSANEYEKQVGDEVQLISNKNTRSMLVTGIYQDVTNGGRTAKANIEPNYETATWFNIYVDVDKDIFKKIQEYELVFEDVKIIGQKGYLEQTFGNTIEQLRLLTITAIIVAILVTVLITSLFLKMLIARDKSQIAIKKSIGISIKDIKIEYITKSLLVLNIGIIIGTLISNTLGQKLFSVILAMMGAPKFKFIINPIEAYILSPVMMIIIVTLTTLLSINSIRQITIADINVE